MFSNMGCFWGFSTCWLQTQPPANSDCSMQVVLEGFCPFDNREHLGHLGCFWFLVTFLVLQSLPLLREILAGCCRLEISSGSVAANGVSMVL
jgi:hypothetical protein